MEVAVDVASVSVAVKLQIGTNECRMFA